MNILLTEALLDTKQISNAAIIRIKDGNVRAKSSNFSISDEEYKVICNAFDNPQHARSSESGIYLMEVPYKAIRADSQSVYGKNADSKSGIIICKTNGLYILGTYDQTMFASVAVEAVEKLADYFRKKNK